MHNILIIDDDDKIRNLLSKYLNEQTYNTFLAEDAENAKVLINANEIDLIIMDVMMPGISGINLTSEFKNDDRLKDIPIIMLSALNAPTDRVNGLEIGADDYMSKPFEPRELLIRINRLLNTKQSQIKSDSNIVQLGSMKFNIYTGKLLDENEEMISLTSTEINLLQMLAKNVNAAVSREEIASKCYGISERSIDVQIVRLRNKIEKDPKNPKYLLTVRNIGYGLYT